jgi:electron transfer flavoprotein alpha subunit
MGPSIARPVVDADWLPREYQIGSSGQTVAPKLYFAIGISGAIQHIVGMGRALHRCINKDPKRPFLRWLTVSQTICSKWSRF